MNVHFAAGRAELPIRLPAALTGFAAREGLAHEVLDPLQARVRAGWLSPVPGGVGPLTIAMLLKTTLDAAGRSVREGSG